MVALDESRPRQVGAIWSITIEIVAAIFASVFLTSLAIALRLSVACMTFGAGELFRIKEEGLAKAVGLAAGPASMMMPLLRNWDFDALITHNRFTLANRSANAMLDLAASKGIAVLNAAPYASGVLAKGSTVYPRYAYQEASEEMLDPIRKIEAICTLHGVPPGAAALQFSMRDPRIASTICGVTKPERVKQTVNWARFPIPEEAWAELMALSYATEDPEATRDYKLG